MKIFKGNLNCKSARAVKATKPDFSASSWPKKQTHLPRTQKVLKRKRVCCYMDAKNRNLPAQAKDPSNSLFSQKRSEQACSAHCTRKS